MKLFTKSVVAAALGLVTVFLGVNQANAATSSYSVSGTYSASTPFSSTITLDGFDTSLGTLVSVTVTLSSGISTDISVTSVTTASNVNATTKVTFSLSGNGVTLSNVVESGDYVVSSVAAGDTVTSGALTASSSTSTVVTDGIALTYYEADTVTFNLGATARTTISFDNGNASASQVTEGTDVVTVTYTYTAVPEPSTWAMIFGGVGALVLVQRMRRHKEA
ncbi:MAG: choice-of-anchor E domain-containing protein [Chthoniobacteraceae bacterium]